MKRALKWRIALTLPIMLLTVQGVFGTDISAGELKIEHLSVGYIHHEYHGVPRLDAKAAFKSLSRTLGAQNGYDVRVSVSAFDNAQTFAEALATQPINLIVLDSWSFLDIYTPERIEPMFVSTEEEQVMKRYLLLARDGVAENLEELRGKSLNMITGPTSTLARHWLNTVLKMLKAPAAETFFGSLVYAPNPSATVLPVLFGKRDAALVDAIKFELMTELNPQLSYLKIVAASEPLVTNVVCFSPSGWSREVFRKDMVRALNTLHRTPAGQQILALYRTGRLVPFKPEYLGTVRKLRETLKAEKHDVTQAQAQSIQRPL